MKLVFIFNPCVFEEAYHSPRALRECSVPDAEVFECEVFNVDAIDELG